jgi:[ribulose-bisphosphate carboxylase]/[fructose-bisphosphate aldolase]-lysine N-methyltransferase
VRVRAGEDAFLMEAIFRGEVWDFMRDPVSAANEEAVCTSMAAGCDAALEGYGTTLAEDIKALDTCDGAEELERYIALRVRMVRRRAPYHTR